MNDPRDYADDDIQLADPRQESFGAAMTTRQEVMPANMQLSPRQVGDLFGTLTTAQKVIVNRDHQQLMTRLKALTASFGDTYIYSWDVNDKNSKRADKKTTIEGPTIKLAMDLAREYGNCSVDVREVEGPTFWIFYARFTDLETGYQLTRSFRQRKNALAGNYENDRKLDMAYQMGQSKASRNVVVNALSNYIEFMMTEAKRAAVAAIEKSPKKYIEAILRGLEKFGIPLSAAEQSVGRVEAEWVARDIAKVMNGLKAINEGLADAREVFPHTVTNVPTEDEETDSPAADPEQQEESDEGAATPSSEAEPGAAKSREAPDAAPGEAEPSRSNAKASQTKAKPEKTAAPAPSPTPTKAPAKKPAALF